MNDRKTKNELIAELESVRRKVKKLETLLKKRKHTEQDITKRKRAEEEIKNLAKFPSENPFPILRLNQDGIILYANEASQVLLQDWDLTVGGYSPKFWCDLSTEVLNSQKRRTITVGCGQLFYSFIVVPISGADYVNLYGEDITERKRAEEELQRSEIQYRSLTENSPDLIARFDRQYRHSYVNPTAAKAGRYSPYEYIGKTIAEVGVPEEEARKWEERIRTVFETGQVVDVEDSFETPNGSRNFHTKFVPEFAPDGSIHSVQSIARDITERKLAELVSTRAEKELHKSHEELRMLADHLQTIREEERKHMAREFHDQLGQSMTALKMDLSLLIRTISDEKQDIQRKLVAEELRSMQKLVDDTIRLIWNIIAELRPQMLDDLGLLATFEWETKQFESRTGISCEFKSSVGDIQLDSKKSIALFRIYQEALTNIARHANATVVKSVLRRDDGTLVLEIRDNGCGISIDEQLKQKSLGLIGMRERALAIGGSFEISGAAGEGTTIIVRLSL